MKDRMILVALVMAPIVLAVSIFIAAQSNRECKIRWSKYTTSPGACAEWK